MELSQENDKSGSISSENTQEGEKSMENKIEETENAKKLREDYEQLKADDSPVLTRNRKKAKKSKSKPASQAKVGSKATINNKGGDFMRDYNNAVKVLRLACKELKLSAPTESNTQAKSKISVWKANNAKGDLLVSIRAKDVVIRRPQDKIGFGKSGPLHWEHVTVLKHNDPNLKAAMKKGFGIKKTQTEWIRDLGVTKRVQGAVKTVDQIKKKEANLKAELKELLAAKKSVAKTSKRKTSSKGRKAISKVAPAKA